MSISDLWNWRKKSPRFECHLQEFREATGTSLEELAEHCKVSIQTIEQVESAEYEPSIVLAEHLAQRLHTAVETLFTAHLPTPKSNSEDERIQKKVGKVGLWLSYFLVFGSLVAANILFFENNQTAGIAVFIVWAVGAIAFLVALSFIPGYWRTLRKQNRTQSKPLFWFRVIGSPILFAGLMMLLPPYSSEPFGKRILSFFFLAIFWGGWMYWLQYRKVKPISK